MLAFGHCLFLLSLFIFILLECCYRRQRNVKQAILPQPSQMSIEPTKDLKENKLHLAETLTQMKQSTRTAKAKSPLDEIDCESRLQHPNNYPEWTWQKDNKLLLAVARLGCDQEFPDFERIASEYFGSDGYSGDELVGRFYFLAYQDAIDQLTRTALANYRWDGSAPKR